MLAYTGKPIQLVSKFPSDFASPDSVGYTLLNTDGTTAVARSTSVYNLGNGAFSATITPAAAFHGIIKWDCTLGAVTRYAYEDLTVIDPVSASVDLTPVLDALADIPTNPLLTNDARLGNLDAAISTRLATSAYTAPDNTGIADIRAVTDSLGAAPSAAEIVTAVEASAIIAKQATSDLIYSGTASIIDLLTIPGYVGPVIPVPAPVNPALQVLYGVCLLPNGQVAAGITVVANLKTQGQVILDENEFLIRQELESTTDEHGQFALILIKGRSYTITISDHGKSYSLVISADDVSTLALYLGGV